MDENLIKYFAGELTSFEEETLFHALENDGSLMTEFIRIQNSQALAHLSSLSVDREEGEKGYRVFLRRLKSKKQKRVLQHVVQYAAMALLLIGSTFFITNYINERSHKYEQNTLFVPAGQRAKLTLQDGSTVWLNAQSTLTYPAKFSGKKRQVEISGEAYFEIAQNKKMPFVVIAQNIEMEVLGTEFNVYNYPEAGYVKTDLIEGSLKVSDNKSEQLSVILKPSEQVTIKDGEMIVGASEYSDYFLWREGIYAFENEKLLNILEKLQLYYDVKIVVEDPEIFNMPYTGKFRQRDGIDEILRILQKIKPFEIIKETDRNIITLTK